VMVLSRRIELPNMVTVQGAHHADLPAGSSPHFSQL
jgi:hypothetical protein